MSRIGIISEEELGSSSAESASFKMKRKSALASKLRSSISKHLRRYYSHDHVLAEYITVLVCNGKNQQQARRDLEAFLGHRTEELWNLLLKYAHHAKKGSVSDRDKDSKVNSFKDFLSHDHGSVTMNAFKVEDDEMCQLPTVSYPDVYNVNDHRFTEDFQQVRCFSAPSSEIYSNKVSSHSCKNELHTRIGAAENVLYDSSANESLREESSSDVKQNYQCMDKANKIVHSSCNMPFDQLIPRREPAFRIPQPSTSEKIILPRSVDVEFREKYRISVWDRLGKPCDGVSLGGKTVEVCGGLSTVYQKQKVLNQHKAVLPVLNSELKGSMTRGVPIVGNAQLESRKLERSMGTMHGAHAASNIRRKRHFGEICSDPDALAGGSRKELQCQDFSQNSKRLNFFKEDSKATPNLASEVLDVKHKLQKIEMEMSRLRSKQVEMAKDGKSNVLSHSAGKSHAEEDTESRTVLVTNVHFAATKEALSLYFAKCGVVVNVLILTDKTTGQRKGSAYVTFASKDSVEKAVALSGATFFSRTLKVTRKAESTLTMVRLAGKPSQALSSHVNRQAVPNVLYSSRSSHRQWRRDSSSSEPAAPANVEEQQSASTLLRA